MEPADSTLGPRHPVERRTFMAIVAGGLLAAPLAAEAQSTGKPYRVGYLSSGASILDPFRQGLRELGYIEG